MTTDADGAAAAAAKNNESSPTITITICSNLNAKNDKIQINTAEVTNVKELKKVICDKYDWEVNNVKLIKKGKTLIDLQSLEDSDLTTDSKLYVICTNTNKRPPSSQSSPISSNAPKSSANNLPTTPDSNQSNPLGAFGAGGMPNLGMDMNSRSMAEMQQKLMQNPEMMNSIMQSPMFQNLMKNPDLMQNMMMQNPQTRALLEKNPQLNQVLKDPSMMQDMMKMYSSQAASDQMNYQNDMALRQLDNSGHFSKVESMFNNINNAFEDWPDQHDDSLRASLGATSGSIDASNNSTSVPNPWGTTSNQLQRSISPANNTIQTINKSELQQKYFQDPNLHILFGQLHQELLTFFQSNPKMFNKYFAPLGSDNFFFKWFEHPKITKSKEPIATKEFLADPKVALSCAKIAVTLNQIANHYLGFYNAVFPQNGESIFCQVAAHIGMTVKSQVERTTINKVIDGTIPPSAPIVLPKPKASEENITKLIEMGFTREQSIVALEQSLDNFETALEILLSRRG